MDRSTRQLLILVQVFFGLIPWLGKLAMEAFEPRAVLVWRVGTGAFVLGLAAWWRHGRRVWPGWRDLGALLGLSLLGISANQLLFLEGLSRSTAVNAGLLMCVIPVTTYGIALAFGQERPTTRRLVGIGLSVLGVAWLFLRRGAGLGGDTVQGDLLMTLNAVSYSFYLVLAKPLLARLPRLVVIAWIFVGGLLTVPWLSLDARWVPPAAEARHWWALVGILLFPTVLAYLLNVLVLARISASTTAAWVMLQPVVAGTLGVLLLGERPDLSLALTAAAVLTGLWLVSHAARPGLPLRASAPP